MIVRDAVIAGAIRNAGFAAVTAMALSRLFGLWENRTTCRTI
jgi:hypothetical protein